MIKLIKDVVCPLHFQSCRRIEDWRCKKTTNEVIAISVPRRFTHVFAVCFCLGLQNQNIQQCVKIQYMNIRVYIYIWSKMGDPHPKLAAILGFITGLFVFADFSPWLTSTLGVVYGSYSSWAHAILIDTSAWVALQRHGTGTFFWARRRYWRYGLCIDVGVLDEFLNGKYPTKKRCVFRRCWWILAVPPLFDVTWWVLCFNGGYEFKSKHDIFPGSACQEPSCGCHHWSQAPALRLDTGQVFEAVLPRKWMEVDVRVD
jgi:hypothetical protein